MDSTSGQLEHASGALASLPGKVCWPEGMVSCVRAACAPEPVSKSEGNPSYGKSPGSKGKSTRGKQLLRILLKPARIIVIKLFLTTRMILEEPKDPSEEFVIYKAEAEAEAEEENLTSKEGLLFAGFCNGDGGNWSDKALWRSSNLNFARARRNIFKEERLQAERMRPEEIGPMAYY